MERCERGVYAEAVDSDSRSPYRLVYVFFLEAVWRFCLNRLELRAPRTADC